MKIPEVMVWLIEEYYTYEYILTLIKYIYELIQEARFWFKEYIETTTLKAGFKQWETDPCLLYMLNEIGTLIAIVYVDETLTIRDKPELVYFIEFIKK